MADNDFGSLLADVSAPTTTDAGTEGLNAVGANEETVDNTDQDAAGSQNEDQGGKDDKSDASADDKSGEGDKGDKADLSPSKVQAALKAMRDSGGDPKIAAHLKDVYGRYQGYTKVFPKVADAMEAKTTLEAVGGQEGVARLQQTIASVNETDQALYSGKKEVIENLYQECVENKHPEAFGKLAPHFLDTLAAKDASAYEAIMAPRHLSFLQSVNFPGVINALGKALTSGDTKVAQSIVQEMARFYNDFSKEIKQPATNPDKEAWEKEKEEHQTTQKKQFNDSVGSAANANNVTAIKDALKPYVKGNQYFKSWTPRMINNLGADVHKELYAQLKKDGTYQAQMKALWSQASPNKDEILKYHKSVVDLKIARITKEVLDRDYSGYAKKAVKTTTVTPKDKTKANENQNNAQQAAIFVGQEPKREEIDWNRDPNGVLYTTDKAYLKKTGRLVTWNKRFANRN